jgi:hypothetical protein
MRKKFIRGREKKLNLPDGEPPGCRVGDEQWIGGVASGDEDSDGREVLDAREPCRYNPLPPCDDHTPEPGRLPEFGISESLSDATVAVRRNVEVFADWERTGRDRTGLNKTVGEILSAGVDSNEEQYPVNPAELKGDSKFEIGSKQSGVGTFRLSEIDDTFDGESLVGVVEDVDNKVLLDDISNLSWVLLDGSVDDGNGIIIIINFV